MWKNTLDMKWRKQLTLFTTVNTLYYVSFYLLHAFDSGLRPTNQTTQYDGSSRARHVTLYHTYPHWSTIKLLVNLKPKKTEDSLHTNPPLACHTQQYAAQITPNIEHKYAPWYDHWPSASPVAAASAGESIMDNNTVSTEPQMGPPW